MTVNQKLLKPYKPRETEGRIYALWEKSGYFSPDKCIEKGVASKNAPSFSIILPPPNVTGTLHMGHAVMLALQDILIRYNRMLGNRTLWLPGTDHAAIATQSKVEEMLYKKEKITRHDLGRENFLKRVEEFRKDSHDTIVKQIRGIGSSVDWSREVFSLDEKRGLAVRTAFKKMYDDGLIYRGARIVNWDPKLQTTVSDDEVLRVEEKAPFYYLKYGPFTIGTARPETKFGDKYVVMHPNDKRYNKYKHREKIELEWINGPITATIIKDESVDMDFGTGVMTITPWHDALDFEIAERHKLQKEQIIDSKGKLLQIGGKFTGIHIKKVRPLVVELLKSKNLIEKIDKNYSHNLATNSRGGGIIEPQVMEQWFIDVNKPFTLHESELTGIKSGSKTNLKEIMRTVIESKQIEILPSQFEKTYYHWIDNLQDWCISRQIWYGHRIPVWYCTNGTNVQRPTSNNNTNCMEPIVSIEEIKKCPQCGEKVTQDPDTLDTWFSSALWTFSTLGWPSNALTAVKGKLGPENDLANFHPTDVIETGYDILFFWVARMILMSGYHLGNIPFKKIYLHGLVRDATGRKMSKSLGNIIDPLDMSQKYGADAARLSLIIGNTPGTDMKLSEDKIRGYKHFSNKIWNIARFVLENTENFDTNSSPQLTSADKKIQIELDALIHEVTSLIDSYKLYLAGEKLYHYVWHTFADKIIEESKSILSTDTSNNHNEKTSKQWILLEVLIHTLKMLHPFIPFITEELWSFVPVGKNISKKKDALLMIEKWPVGLDH